MDQKTYSEEEKAMIREQLAEGNRIALETARKRGAEVHHRVLAIRHNQQSALTEK